MAGQTTVFGFYLVDLDDFVLQSIPRWNSNWQAVESALVAKADVSAVNAKASQTALDNTNTQVSQLNSALQGKMGIPGSSSGVPVALGATAILGTSQLGAPLDHQHPTTGLSLTSHDHDTRYADINHTHPAAGAHTHVETDVTNLTTDLSNRALVTQYAGALALPDDASGIVVAGATIGVLLRMPWSTTISEIAVELGAAPSGGPCTVQLLKNGSNFGSAISVAANTLRQTSSGLSLAVAKDDRITANVTAVNGAKTATVFLIGA